MLSCLRKGSLVNGVLPKGVVVPQTEPRVFIEIDELLSAGLVPRAYALVMSSLRRAADGQDRLLNAQLQLRLALCDLAQSRVRRGLEGAQRALMGLRSLQALRAEVQAQMVWSRAATALGYQTRAMEAAMLACRLADDLPLGQDRAEAQLTLGIACSWGRAQPLAEQAFAGALGIVQRLGVSRWALEVHIQRALSRLVQAADTGARTGAVELRSDYHALRSALEASASQGLGAALLPEAAAGHQRAAALVCGLLACELGRKDDAKHWLHTLETDLAVLPQRTWLQAGLHWLRSAMAEQQGQPADAIRHAQRMAQTAHAMECLQLACLGHGRAAALLERQGQLGATLVELRCQRALERARDAREAQALPDRVAQQIAARDNDQRVEVLSEESRRFRQLAFEDPLTGLANLRRFNQCLEEVQISQSAGGDPPCAALIDVDQFKRINDGFSHAVGDQVLQALASILQACVRETDLAARLGGDEFAILFQATEEATARQIVERILQQVQDHPWTDIAQGLHVRISVGVVQARPGDGGRSLVERSDAAMYQHKRATQAGELGSG